MILTKKNILKKYNLSKFNDDELCMIYNELNVWDWPSLLPEKPNDWDKMSNKKKMLIIWPLKEAISEKVSRKAMLQWHWIHNLNRTKEEFEYWLDEKIREWYLTNNHL